MISIVDIENQLHLPSSDNNYEAAKKSRRMTIQNKNYLNLNYDELQQSTQCGESTAASELSESEEVEQSSENYENSSSGDFDEEVQEVISFTILDKNTDMPEYDEIMRSYRKEMEPLQEVQKHETEEEKVDVQQTQVESFDLEIAKNYSCDPTHVSDETSLTTPEEQSDE